MEELSMPFSGLAPQRSWTRKMAANRSLYEAETAVATELKNTGVFAPRKKKGSKKDPKAPDGSRVNIVDKKLVSDVISYLKPSLQRHKGCDLVSIYPGAGLFSKALHDAVGPRSHLLLEPDEDLYEPFLKPLLKKKNVKLIPKSGIIWQELQEALTPENLPNQVEFDRLDLNKDPPKNDTLLVDINLSMYPKKQYNLFDSMSRMILYQLITSIRTSTQFQKYGQVRMLVWIPDDEKTTIIPRVIQLRKRGAIEAELMTEYIAEVCGKDGTLDDADEGVKGRNDKVRPHQLNFESLRQAMVRMRDSGVKTPRGRETRLLRQFKKEGISLDTPFPLTQESFSYDKSFQAELEDMQRQFDTGRLEKGTKAGRRFKMLGNYNRWIDKLGGRLLEFTQQRDAAAEVRRQADQAEADGEAERAQELLEESKRLNDEYNRAVRQLADYVLSQLALLRDHLHVLRQPEEMGPVLSWDRRPWEPLRVKATEFFPNQPCALIDIQPKAPHKLLRHVGPGTTNAGDIFDLMLGVIMTNTVVPLIDNMDLIWPGASEGIEPLCKSLVDPARGGTPLTGEAAVGSRAANQVQLLELLEQFMKWPFMPSYADLVGRLEDDRLVDDSSLTGIEEDGPGGIGMGNTTIDAF
ncbi:hypothetical protein J7T55_011235 [Diaporthe amygdali]|uniref:uncharacterized protein n=1 Tax=Phomopsis amygdali TaxID=1214568 RepID=UPI0022FE90A8|nr:uncharacterized protein J7T55_011235 [Diaporthe amygdali]KAJ0108745.1 hypothetical protein J7T55_011235 [Diaporthe amygdali]